MIESNTVSEGGNLAESRVQGFDVAIDADTESGPSPTGSLLASYASCYTVALRIAAEQRDVGALGRIEIDAEADQDDGGSLESIRFDVGVATDADEEALDAVVERATELCHVDDALRDGLRADVSVRGGAF